MKGSKPLDLNSCPQETQEAPPPILFSSPPDNDAAVLPNGGQRTLQVLIAEADPVTKDTVSSWLCEQGHSVFAVENGETALAMTERDRFDVLLIDVLIPGMNGYDLTRAIRGRERQRSARRIPVIALIAGAMKGDHEICVEAGMDGCLSRPVNLQKLERMLESLPGDDVVRAVCA